MRSSFLGFEVSKRSIQISQKALDITSSNLSNRKTEGYTRQRVDLNSTYLTTSGKYATKFAKLTLSGQGVNAYGVSQIRDPYIDKRYREYAAIVAENDTKYGISSDIENVLDDIGNTGLIKGLDKLKSDLNNYAGNATNKELASVIRNSASSVCQLLNNYSSQLNNLMLENRTALDTSVNDVNTLIDKISQYNGVIVGEYNITSADLIYKGENVSGAYGPNELLDQRNVLIDELSNYGNINVIENSDGSVQISMGGTTIINGTKTEHIVTKDFENYGAAVLKFTNGESVDLESGDLKAYQDMLNGNGSYASYYQNNEYGIPYYISTLDAFASSFAKLMNETNGCTDTDTTRAMFATDADTYDANGNILDRATVTAGNIRISDEWMADPTMIGQNYDAASNSWVLSLDGTNVNKLILAIEQDITVGRTGEFKGSVYDYCLFVDNRFAESASFYKDQYELATSNATALLDERSAVSGVSETEEGINMLSFQKWFNASSRMMTTMDDCLDRIINNMGRVGL